MPTVKYGVKKDVKKPETADQLPSQARAHISQVHGLDKVSKLTGEKYGKAVVKSDGELRQN